MIHLSQKTIKQNLKPQPKEQYKFRARTTVIPHPVVFQPKMDQKASCITGVTICEMNIKAAAARWTFFLQIVFYWVRAAASSKVADNWSPVYLLLAKFLWNGRLTLFPTIQNSSNVNSLYIMLSLPELIYLYKRSEMRCHHKATQNTSFLLFFFFSIILMMNVYTLKRKYSFLFKVVQTFLRLR